MGIRLYLKEYWAELWNPESRAWQKIDRYLFILLPLISLLRLFISQAWRDTVFNLIWIVPMTIWFIFILFVVPYRMVANYHDKFLILKKDVDDLRKIVEDRYPQVNVRQIVLRAIAEKRRITPEGEDIIVIPQKENGLQMIAPQDLNSCLRKLAKDEEAIILVRFPNWALEATGDVASWLKLQARKVNQSDYFFTVRVTDKFTEPA